MKTEQSKSWGLKELLFLRWCCWTYTAIVHQPNTIVGGVPIWGLGDFFYEYSLSHIESGCVVCMSKSLMHIFWRWTNCWRNAMFPLSSTCEKHFRGSGGVLISRMAKATVPKPFGLDVACVPQTAVTETDGAGNPPQSPLNSGVGIAQICPDIFFWTSRVKRYHPTEQKTDPKKPQSFSQLPSGHFKGSMSSLFS